MSEVRPVRTSARIGLWGRFDVSRFRASSEDLRAGDRLDAVVTILAFALGKRPGR